MLKLIYSTIAFLVNVASIISLLMISVLLIDEKVSELTSIPTSPIFTPILFLVMELVTGVQLWSI